MWLSAFLNPAFCKPRPTESIQSLLRAVGAGSDPRSNWIFSHFCNFKKSWKDFRRKERVIRGVFYCFTTFQKNSWWMTWVRLWESSQIQTDSFISLLQMTCRLLVLVSTLPRTNWDQQAADHMKSRDHTGISCSLIPSSPAPWCVPCWNSRFLFFVIQGVCLIKTK